MSDAGAEDLRGWVTSVARRRGVTLEPAEADRVAALVVPTLEAFATIAGELTADEDAFAFRRLLEAEASGG
jgi:hypothetical protein